MIKDINRKIDVVAKLERDFEKKLDNVDKRLGGLIRHVNKVIALFFVEINFLRLCLF
jgi:hypothetical protein